MTHFELEKKRDEDRDRRISELEAEVERLRGQVQDISSMWTTSCAEVAALREDKERLKASIIRRSGASSWDEWSGGIWDPTEETAVDAITRLAKERDAAVQRADKQEDLTRKALQSAYQAQQCH